MKYLSVKNWETFQHYKERTPPWIKLHRDLLRDYTFSCLQDASKLHLMLIWLLASQLDNKIPADAEFIRKQIGVSGEIDFNELISKGFLIDDSGLLAGRKQVAILETETETETETDKKEDTNVSSKKGSHAKPVGLSDLNITHIEDWLEEKRKSGLYISVDEDRLLERFKNYCTSKNKTYKNYIAAFKNSFEWENVPQKKPNQNKLDPETLKLFKGGGL